MQKRARVVRCDCCNHIFLACISIRKPICPKCGTEHIKCKYCRKLVAEVSMYTEYKCSACVTLENLVIGGES